MYKKECSFMGLVGFEYPLKVEMKLPLEQENLDSALKSISTWSPACILNLKMWISKMSTQQAKIFGFLKSCFSKWENGRRMNWHPPKKYTPTPRTTPWNQEYFDLLKTQNSNYPLTLAGGWEGGTLWCFE